RPRAARGPQPRLVSPGARPGLRGHDGLRVLRGLRAAALRCARLVGRPVHHRAAGRADGRQPGARRARRSIRTRRVARHRDGGPGRGQRARAVPFLARGLRARLPAAGHPARGGERLWPERAAGVRTRPRGASHLCGARHHADDPGGVRRASARGTDGRCPGLRRGVPGRGPGGPGVHRGPARSRAGAAPAALRGLLTGARAPGRGIFAPREPIPRAESLMRRRQMYVFRLAQLAAVLFLTLAAASPAVAQSREQIARGKYIFGAAAGCGCHTEPKGVLNAGGRKYDGPFGTVYSSNITPDPTNGIGKWTDEQIITAIRSGRRPNGERLIPVHPYTVFNGMAEQDLKDVVAYLRSVPPSSKPTPPKKITVPMFESVFLPAWLATFAPREN